MKPLQRAELRRLSSPRLWTPPGLLSPVDVRWATKLDWLEGCKVFDPSAFEPEQWRHLIRLRARTWLELECWLPVTSSAFVAGLGLLIGGHIQDFTTADAFPTADAGSNYVVDGAAYVLRTKGWGAGGGASDNYSTAAHTGVAGDGGGGGFAQGDVNVVPGETLTKRIGAPGVSGLALENEGAGGGGYTGLFRGSTPLIIAGAGAGGGGAYANSEGGDGGAGGGSTGGTGDPSGTVYGTATGATGGTQSVGGTGGNGSAQDGANGASLAGGAGAQGSVATKGGGKAGGAPGGAAGGASNAGGGGMTGGGGGGAGYFGGGGGGTSTSGGGSSGGGGGSNYVSGANTVSTQASGLNPANSGDVDWATNVGLGGTGGGAPGSPGGQTTPTAGFAGRLVVRR